MFSELGAVFLTNLFNSRSWAQKSCRSQWTVLSAGMIVTNTTSGMVIGTKYVNVCRLAGWNLVLYFLRRSRTCCFIQLLLLLLWPSEEMLKQRKQRSCSMESYLPNPDPSWRRWTSSAVSLVSVKHMYRDHTQLMHSCHWIIRNLPVNLLINVKIHFQTRLSQLRVFLSALFKGESRDHVSSSKQSHTQQPQRWRLAVVAHFLRSVNQDQQTAASPTGVSQRELTHVRASIRGASVSLWTICCQFYSDCLRLW